MPKKWLKAAAIRATRTAAQAALAAIGSATMFGEVDWRMVGSTALLAAIASILMSITGLPEVEKDEGDGE
jgi:hypothetical protein